jgi:diadenosine tetraphosphate (Ap4A) HIT family hydrolase
MTSRKGSELALGDNPSATGCLFCALVTTKPGEPALALDDGIWVAPDRFPIAHGHLLVFPAVHISDGTTLDSVHLQSLALAVQKCAWALGQLYSERVAVLASGKIIPDHIHVHILPVANGIKETFAGLKEHPRPEASLERRHELLQSLARTLRRV